MEIQDEKPGEDQSIDQEVAEQNVEIDETTIPAKLSDGTKEVEKARDSEDPEDEDQYVTGFKLWTLMASLTLVMFLMMLDMSIIVTVCTMVPSALEAGLIESGDSSNHDRFSLPWRCWLVWQCVLDLKVRLMSGVQLIEIWKLIKS
jgi:hypothetical protein